MLQHVVKLTADCSDTLDKSENSWHTPTRKKCSVACTSSIQTLYKRLAGYSAKAAHPSASVKLSKPNVQSRIAELKDLIVINAIYVLKRLKGVSHHSEAFSTPSVKRKRGAF